MPLAERTFFWPIPRLLSPSDGRSVSLSQRERVGVRVSGHPTQSALSRHKANHNEKMRRRASS